MQTHMRRVTFDTPLGRCALSWHEAGLTDFELPEASPRESDATALPTEISQLIDRVRLHLSGSHPQDFSDVRYDFSTLADFNLAVLRETLRIRAGATTTYGAIAAALGQPSAASRAVGAALGANRWPLLIPCHRVVAADGRMTGFSGPGGIRTKTRLLALEGAQLLSE